MVLKLLLLTVALTVNSIAANASIVEGVFKYRVTNSKCVVRQKTPDGWIQYRKPLKEGLIAIGRPNSKKPDIIMFKTAATKGVLLAAKQSCLFANKDSVRGEVGNIDLSIRSRFMILFGTFHWQEEITLDNSETKTSTPLRVTNVSISPSLQFFWGNDRIEYGLAAQFIYGKAQVANARNPDTHDDARYAASNVDLAGLNFSPAILLRPAGGGVAFGINAPILFRYGAYPLLNEVADTIKIGPRKKILAGVLLESRFERGSFIFSQKVGFLGRPKSLTWGLDTGWSF